MPETFEVSDALLEKFLAQHVEVDLKPLFAEGTIVGEWTLTGFLGRGGSAEVYCARQQSNGQAVAIKVLHRTEPEQLERFAREADFLADHPCSSFPVVFGRGVIDGRRKISFLLWTDSLSGWGRLTTGLLSSLPVAN